MELREQTAKDVRDRRARNGGFPEPPEGEPVRVVRVAHRTCGGETRIRLSPYLPPRAVQRVVCQHCEVSYACDRVELVDEGAVGRIALPAREAPTAEPATDGARAGVASGADVPATAGPAPERGPRSALPPPESGLWRWIGIPVAAAAVVVAMLLLQGDEEKSDPVVVGPGGAASESGGGGSGSKEARFISQPGFSLALPPGWERSVPEGGAAFAATAEDGTANATLWIEEAPELTFAAFEARSLEQLRSLTGSAEVAERVAAPTEEGTVVTLRSGPAEGSGDVASWQVTLRAAGPYRYHLATVVQPGAPREAREGAELIHGSFVPEPDGTGKIRTGVAPGSVAATPETAPAPPVETAVPPVETAAPPVETPVPQTPTAAPREAIVP
jgi:hypothetical protein